MSSKGTTHKAAAKRLRQQTKALKRTAAMIQQVGDQVNDAAEDVNAALSSAWVQGYEEALHAAILRVQAATTLESAKASMDAMAADHEEDKR